MDISDNIEFTSAGAFTLLNGCVPGDNSNNRTGRKISMTSMQIRGYVNTVNNSSATAADFLRLILVYDRQPNAALPALADVLQATAQGGGTTSGSFDPLNINNADRFKVLRNWNWGMLTTLGAGVVPVAALLGPQTCDNTTIDEYIQLKGMEAHYNAGTAGTVADITTGSIFLLAVGLESAANNSFRFTFTARLRFHDQ